MKEHESGHVDWMLRMQELADAGEALPVVVGPAEPASEVRYFIHVEKP